MNLFPILIALMCAMMVQNGEGKQETGTVPLYQFYLYSTVTKNYDGFWTTDKSEPNEVLMDGATPKIEDHGIVGYIYKTETPDTVPLHRYYNGRDANHLYTTRKMELGDGAGEYKYEKIAGHVLRNPTPGALPWYRFYSIKDVNHHYTTTLTDIVSSRGAYVEEGNEGYIFGPN